jgi:uncharacterized protein
VRAQDKNVDEGALELRVHASMREFDRESWNAWLAPDFVPHMSWEFLEALEATGCVRAEAGWLPRHLSLWQAGELVACAPAYIKGNSEGEFVFDYSWARFAEQALGAPYYPKLVVAVPFTPATGPRLLTKPGLDAQQAHVWLARGVRELVERHRMSGAHVLFPRESGANAWEAAGFARRAGVQYHFHNCGYRTFDDFLSRFSSKRRHQLKRERKELSAQGIELRAVTGSDLRPAELDAMVGFYTSTVDKYYYGRRYLNRAFFEEICARLPHNVLVVLAYERGGQRPIAGAFNLVSERALFGRYWGSTADVPFLHFNVCYYAGIDVCIERGLDTFEPGAGGEHKHARGFESTVTHSVHHLRDARLRGPVLDFLSRERAAIDAALQSEKPLFKPVSAIGQAELGADEVVVVECSDEEPPPAGVA